MTFRNELLLFSYHFDISDMCMCRGKNKESISVENNIDNIEEFGMLKIKTI